MREPGEQVDRHRKAQGGERGHFGRQRANRGGGTFALAVQIDAEPVPRIDPQRQVGRVPLAILLPVIGREHGQHGVFDVLPVERALAERVYRSVDPQRRWSAGDEEQVAPAPRHQRPQPALEARRCPSEWRIGVGRVVQGVDEGIDIVLLHGCRDYRRSCGARDSPTTHRAWSHVSRTEVRLYTVRAVVRGSLQPEPEPSPEP